MSPDLVMLYRRLRSWGHPPKLALSIARRRLAEPVRVGESKSLLPQYVTHTLGPFALYAARDVSDLLSYAKRNERWIPTGKGTVYVVADLPENLPSIWRLS